MWFPHCGSDFLTVGHLDTSHLLSLLLNLASQRELMLLLEAARVHFVFFWFHRFSQFHSTISWLFMTLHVRPSIAAQFLLSTWWFDEIRCDSEILAGQVWCSGSNRRWTQSFFVGPKQPESAPNWTKIRRLRRLRRGLEIPSGKRLHSYGKSLFFIGKSTISMAIFNSFLYVYQRVLSTDIDYIDWWTLRRVGSWRIGVVLQVIAVVAILVFAVQRRPVSGQGALKCTQASQKKNHRPWSVLHHVASFRKCHRHLHQSGHVFQQCCIAFLSLNFSFLTLVNHVFATALWPYGPFPGYLWIPWFPGALMFIW